MCVCVCVCVCVCMCREMTVGVYGMDAKEIHVHSRSKEL